jgi:DNA-binding transcriptional regulator YhcF (GntR family)
VNRNRSAPGSSAICSADRIASGLRQSLLAGELPHDQALPSVRFLARREGIGTATAQAAYRQLAAEGLVESRPGIGWFPIRRTGTRRRKIALAALRDYTHPAIQQALAKGLSRTLIRREILQLISPRSADLDE